MRSRYVLWPPLGMFDKEPLGAPFASLSAVVPRGLTSGGLGWGTQKG